MSYTPTTWQTGDTITAEKLNNMESGIENGQTIIVTITNSDGIYSADKTYSELVSAIESGKTVFCYSRRFENGEYFIFNGSTPYGLWFGRLTSGNFNECFLISPNNIVSVLREQLYIKPSSGIPEAHLAQGVKDKLNPFIVTLTPTAADYSGTMDKTIAEINAAYVAGQQIVFRTMMSATEHMDTDCTARWFNGSTYPSFNGFILDNEHNMIIFAYTGAKDDGTGQTYGTKLYPLTTMSE